MRKADSLVSSEKLDSELLRTFLAVADTGSFSKGAERIYRSQSAASLQIKRLESLLNRPVFERHARGVTLTPTGERLRPVAQSVVNMLDETMGALRQDALQGSVRIGIPDEYGRTVLPDVIAAFSRNNARVELDVRCGFSACFPDDLANETLDLAVHTAETAKPGTHVLLKERTVWVGSTLHRAHEQDPLPLALFHRACWWHDRALEALESAGRRYRVVYTSKSTTGILAAVRCGAAVAAISESVVGEDQRILSTSDGFPDLPDSVLVLERARNATSSAMQAMEDVIIDAFKNGVT